ncbi:MAG: hypothetical protein AB4080_21945 [Trichodesmium sp.]
MKNWNKIGQYIATSAGAALLASFATLASTPKTASAASLSFDGTKWVSDNEQEAVTEIKGLMIGDNFYNVTFEHFTFST